MILKFMDIEPQKRDLKIEKAIGFLADWVRRNCNNPKPLILHSLRVGLKLLDLEQREEVVIAGFLHDLVEDTDCTIKDIEKEFGKEVACLVSALTQEKIPDYKKRWELFMDKIIKKGKEAMIVKVVDGNDNTVHFFSRLKDAATKRKIIWIMDFTIKSLKPHIGNLPLFKEYEESYKKAVHGL